MAKILSHPRVSEAHQHYIDVHLAAASRQQLASLRPRGIRVNTYAYFATDQSNSGEPYVSGLHSSVDFGFEQPIQDAVALRNHIDPDHAVYMPPLTNIQRNYQACRSVYQSPRLPSKFIHRLLTKILHH